MVTDFSAAEKDSGVKFCMCVRLLSGQVFSHFGELWLVGTHGRGITSGMYASTHWSHAAAPGKAQWAVGIGCHGSVGQSELGAAASSMAVGWDLHLASLLTRTTVGSGGGGRRRRRRRSSRRGRGSGSGSGSSCKVSVRVVACV